MITVASLALSAQVGRAQEVSASGQQTIEAEIRAAMTEMRNAAERLDAPALYAYVLDTATPSIIENGELALTRAAALERTAQGFRGIATLSYSYAKESITVLSPDHVLWVGSGTATATLDDGRALASPFAETVVFERSDGRWKVLHAHRSVPSRR
jgi:ketosteroid isomerase-like protein